MHADIVFKCWIMYCMSGLSFLSCMYNIGSGIMLYFSWKKTEWHQNELYQYNSSKHPDITPTLDGTLLLKTMSRVPALDKTCKK